MRDFAAHVLQFCDYAYDVATLPDIADWPTLAKKAIQVKSIATGFSRMVQK